MPLFTSYLHTAVTFFYTVQLQIKDYLLFPNWWQHFLGLIIACKAMDATLNQNQAKLAIFVLEQWFVCQNITVKSLCC